MGFNYGLEKRKFTEEWKKLYSEYKAAGISEEDIQRVKDSLDSVSSKNKEVSIKVMLKVRGERQMCDLKLHTLWSSLKTDGYIGIVGQLDIVK